MKNFIVVFLLLISLNTIAQDKIEVTPQDYQNTSVEMADHMRAEGKIYVLVGIIGIVFAGILVYVISTDRKVSRLEKMLKRQDN
jgi:CcmD family protein